jgi:RHH-type proline utilization regulon transcriptional repressor/proline dehydrogenase/delta 1-pyrroline-5-carboxylate dehydrogenase
LLQEYGLGTEEGVQLLCLAEAFLRIPDAGTAMELVRDKIAPGDWRAHLGRSSSLLVNASTRALLLTQHLLDTASQPDSIAARLMARGGEPAVRGAVRAAMSLIGEQFVFGRNIEEALERARRESESGLLYSFDMLGEAARTAPDARRYLEAYRHAIRAAGADAASMPGQRRPTVSIKLSALHPRYEEAQRERVLSELLERLLDLCCEARDAGVGVSLDAEESDRVELSLDLVQRLLEVGSLRGWEGLGLAVQAYLRRALPLLDWLEALVSSHDAVLAVRLVKGAYWDSEIKRCQERGLDDFPVFTRKSHTDVAFLACARRLLASERLFPAFATHNALTVATVLEWAGARRDFEFQRLHGMGEGLYERLVAEEGIACRLYAPVGSHRDLLAYLVRRLLENGANTSFVHRVSDPEISLDALLADPVEAARSSGGRAHPAIRRPEALFGDEHRNSRGLDLNDRATIASLSDAMQKCWAKRHQAAPLIDGDASTGEQREIRDPSDRRRVVGTVVDADAASVARAVSVAAAGHAGWARRTVEERAACMERAAELLEGERAPFMALAVREAGKAIPDALAEVREAVDFLRYYAVQARRTLSPVALPGPTGESNRLGLHGRGVFACISPWNFPLAIFIGQVAAALVAGNAVVAKPAPQTPLIAASAVRLLHRAGIPSGALQLVPGGPEVGRALLAERQIAGVAFTGSVASARAIARALAGKDGPIVPLIAETGGLNAMIVDSSALPEQVVADVLASGFQSAGQRCSALRLLYLQEEVAPRMLEMLCGAMDELRVGDPGLIETDVGPVIDELARERLSAHASSGIGRRLHRAALSHECMHGVYFAPELIELDDPARLQTEVFGPIVHVARWRAGELDAVIDRINAPGYGLTLGVHSRISAHVERVRQRARVGNLYVNRSMIGAVVGAQPFGGEGLSGTGPKAGGPHYLGRFATERVVSIDTTSAGGNASLMSLGDDP